MMGRFYFDVMDGEAHRDREGEELSDLCAARIAALEIAAAALRDRDADLQEGGELQVSVRDDTGATVFAVTTTARSL